MSAPTLTRPRIAERAVVGVREPYAVSYDRLSRVRSNENNPLVTVGNERQDEDNVAAGVELGGIRERFTDKGSASRFRQRERDDFPRLLDEIRTGRPTHVVIWVLDRIIRDDADRVALINACRDAGTLIVQSSSGTVIDPDDPDSVFLATILGAVAVLEIEKMSKRIRRFKQAARDAGMPNGGKRWFGYAPGNMVEDEVEGPIYRDLVARFLGGETLDSLAKSLNADGVPTIAQSAAWARGEYVRVWRWTGPAVRLILLNQRYAGLVTHGGDVVGPAQWAALVDEATVESVRRKLLDPTRRTNKGSNARVYLLAGLGVCAECGNVLRGRPLHSTTRTAVDADPDERYGDRAYYCSTGKHVHRSVELVDRVVEALVIERLSRTDASGALTDDDAADEARALRADRDAVRARLEALADEYADGDLDTKAYTRATTRIESKLAELDDAIGKASDRATRPAAVLDGMTGEHARKAWAGADLGRRRAIVGLLFSRVALHGGYGGFTPDAVEVAWR
jgi:site-specific DNA recombinase